MSNSTAGEGGKERSVRHLGAHWSHVPPLPAMFTPLVLELSKMAPWARMTQRDATRRRLLDTARTERPCTCPTNTLCAQRRRGPRGFSSLLPSSRSCDHWAGRITWNEQGSLGDSLSISHRTTLFNLPSAHQAREETPPRTASSRDVPSTSVGHRCRMYMYEGGGRSVVYLQIRLSFARVRARDDRPREHAVITFAASRGGDASSWSAERAGTRPRRSRASLSLSRPAARGTDKWC